MPLTYKYRLKDRSARKSLAAHSYAVNQVWNWAVAQQRGLEIKRRGAIWFTRARMALNVTRRPDEVTCDRCWRSMA